MTERALPAEQSPGQSAFSREAPRFERSVRYDWLFAVLGLAVVGGAFLDGWAHSHDRVDESFFTPWHGVLYSSVAVLGAAYVVTLLRTFIRGTHRRLAMPDGYLPSLLGVVLFGAAGLSDLAWHTLFGIEEGIESLLSPSHLILAVAAVLIVSGPLRAAGTRQLASRANWAAAGPPVLAMSATVALLMFMTQHLHPLVQPVGSLRDLPRPLADLYVMAADGTNQHRLTTDLDEWNGFAAWSPDSSALVFVAGKPPQPSDLYVLSVTGGERRRLTNTSLSEWSPSWSPDGSTIAFVTGRRGGQDAEVCLVPAVGGDLRCITETRAEKWGPKWSPDGRRIVFASKASGSWQIHVMNVDGSGSLQLTDAGGVNTAPAWSPDGHTLAFQSDRDGAARIFVMAADGSGQRALTPSSVSAFAPTWSADGVEIAYTSPRGGTTEIYAISAAGGEPRNLTRNAALESSLPAWSPDGRQISFTASGRDDVDRELRRAHGVGAVVTQTALLTVPIIFLLRRRLLPVGAIVVLWSIPAAFVVVLEDRYELLPWVFGSSIVVEFVRGLVQPDVGRRLAVFSFVTPVLLWSGYFWGVAINDGLVWPVHLWSGSIVLSGFVGLLAYVVAPTEGADGRG